MDDETKDLGNESFGKSNGTPSEKKRLFQDDSSNENEANDSSIFAFGEGEDPISFFDLIGFLFHLLLTMSLMPLWIFAAFVFYASGLGIPIGKESFKVFYFALLPNTKDNQNKYLHLGNKAISDLSKLDIILYIAWIFMFGLGLGFAHLGIGILFYATVLYSKYANLHFRVARFAFFPIGAKIVENENGRKVR